MKLPEEVLIDAVCYRIEITDDVILVDDKACRADVDYNRARIRLSSKEDTLGDGRKAQVLMHEVVHAILYERDRDEREDEALVDALASGFVNLIRHNPGLMGFIYQTNTKGA